MSLRIFVLEDEPLIAVMIAEWLEEMGHEVVGPCDAASSALETLASAGRVDGALLDVHLSAGDSYPVAERLLEARVPFAFLTGQQAGSVDARFAAAAVVGKPFDFDSISRAVERMAAMGVPEKTRESSQA